MAEHFGLGNLMLVSQNGVVSKLTWGCLKIGKPRRMNFLFGFSSEQAHQKGTLKTHTHMGESARPEFTLWTPELLLFEWLLFQGEALGAARVPVAERSFESWELLNFKARASARRRGLRRGGACDRCEIGRT